SVSQADLIAGIDKGACADSRSVGQIPIRHTGCDPDGCVAAARCQPTQLMHKGERMKISILSVTIRLHGSVRFDSSKNFSRRFPNLWQRVSRGILPPTVTEAAAKLLGIKLQSLEVRSLDDFESAFARAKKERSQALITTPGPLVATQQRQVLDF